MLPQIVIPLSVPPITAQQDIPKPRPEIAPVTPVQAGAQESGVMLDRQHPQDALELLYEEQHRRQQQQHEHAEQQAQPDAETEAATASAEVLEEYAELEEDKSARQGVWVDIKV